MALHKHPKRVATQIRKERKAGVPQKQAVAISISKSKRGKTRKS